MKKKFSIFNNKVFYYIKQLVYSDNPDSKSEVKKNKVVVENNLRWQDDGGPVNEIENPIDPLAESKSTQPSEATEEGSKEENRV
jgi:hypothetical protein